MAGETFCVSCPCECVQLVFFPLHRFFAMCPTLCNISQTDFCSYSCVPNSFLPVLERANNFPPLPKIVKIKPCFYQNIEEEIPDQHQLLVRRVFQLWMSECPAFIVLGGGVTIVRVEWDLMISPLRFLPPCLCCSVLGHAVHECHFLYCLVGRRWKCHQLWLLAPLAHSLQSLQLHLLVPAALQSLQVSPNWIVLTLGCAVQYILIFFFLF